MGGERYYTFRPKEGVTFFALDSNNMDSKQVQWLERELGKASEGWRIAYFHHPLYSSGRTHGSSLDLRSILEPIFVKFRVQVVFAGHDHFYERIKPQAGVQHFVEGSSGQLRVGNITEEPQTAVGYDEDNTFMLVEIVAEEMYFQTVSRTGQIVDSGSVSRMQVGNKSAALVRRAEILLRFFGRIRIRSERNRAPVGLQRFLALPAKIVNLP